MANKTKAKAFVEKWQNRGDEKQDTSHFWLELLQEVYGDTEIHNDNHISFEVRADKQNKAGKEFKDVVVNRRSKNATLIEQKSFDIDLDHKSKQSDGSLLTPFEQAFKYDTNSSVDDHAKWIITCNFQELRIYDMANTGKDRYEPIILKLEELPTKLDWLNFLLPNFSDDAPKFIPEEKVSVKAGELVGKMYDALLERYAEPESELTQKELNKLCVRLVFCLYADDAGLFDKNDTNKFENYIRKTDAKYVRQALIDLFKVLDQKENERDKYLDETLKSFPYVNGGLFKGEVEIPNFDNVLKKLLVEDEAAAFDWSVVSPTIFGAVFESTLNTETRRSGGMHYTSIENIHKVIDPLFLNDLRSELNNALSYSVASKKENALREFQKKISNLTFLDPACGSGNFLTETYLSLRRLENEVIRQLQGINVALNFDNDSVIKVSIQQMYGIEINDFAVSVAKTALWIAESQMFKETESILSANREYFPLQSFNNVLEGNALKLDWNCIIEKSQLKYIMGNPPFYGARLMTKEQKEDIIELFSDAKNNGNLDYVCGWYIKALEYIKDTSIKCAFVSTNSISQGDSISTLWNELLKYNININYAYQTFIWDSETRNKAYVYVVIVGFDCMPNNSKKQLYTFDEANNQFILKVVDHINPYLMNADDVLISSRNKPLCNVPKLITGSQRIDNDNYIFTKDEMLSFISVEPKSEKYFYRWYGSEEFINNTERYCLWLGKANPSDIESMPKVKEIVEKVKVYRLSSKRTATVKSAKTPWKFGLEVIPESNYLIIPVVSSGKRFYIPLGFMKPDVLCSNQINLVPNADLYDFGVLSSIVNMSWVRVVAGRLGTSYRYSKDIVYNNFPWPIPSDEQRVKIEKTAQSILDARALNPESSLASLYDPLLMPIELKRAHEANDKAVMEAYGFSKNLSEAEIVAKLFEKYSNLVANDGK